MLASELVASRPRSASDSDTVVSASDSDTVVGMTCVTQCRKGLEPRRGAAGGDWCVVNPVLDDGDGDGDVDGDIIVADVDGGWETEV